MNAKVKIALCIATCRRPQSLRRLLDTLLAQTILQNPDFKIHFIIVDNDEEPSAEAVVNSILHQSDSITYYNETHRGISFARNRCVDLARKQNCDCFAFIDDDELAEPEWLINLYNSLCRYDADAVEGPVLPLYETEAVSQHIKDRFIRERYQSGTILPTVATNNLLIKATAIAELAEPFDNRFALSGGEDHMLGVTLAKLGKKIVWENDAVVNELNPTSRLTLKSTLCREFKGGNSHTVVMVLSGESKVRIAARVLKSTAKLMFSIGCLPLSLLYWPLFFWASHQLSDSLGSILGAFSFHYQPYKKIHSTVSDSNGSPFSADELSELKN